MVLLSSPPPINALAFCYLLPEKMKVRGTRKRISPRTMNERVILMKRKDRNNHAMTYLMTTLLTILSLVSRIRLLTSKISHICQEIRDIKNARKTKSNLLQGTYTSTHLDEVQTNQTNTQEPNSSNSAMEGSSDEDGSGDTYSSRSTQYHHEPSNPDNSSRHAPVPPSLNPLPSESTLEPPGD